MFCVTLCQFNTRYLLTSTQSVFYGRSVGGILYRDIFAIETYTLYIGPPVLVFYSLKTTIDRFKILLKCLYDS